MHIYTYTYNIYNIYIHTHTYIDKDIDIDVDGTVHEDRPGRFGADDAADVNAMAATDVTCKVDMTGTITCTVCLTTVSFGVTRRRVRRTGGGGGAWGGAGAAAVA